MEQNNIRDEISKSNINLAQSEGAIGPNFAGQFYPDGFSELNEKLDELFEKGPGDIPVSKREGKINGVLVPHAGYGFSGENAAWAYKEIGEHEFADAYIILSSDHNNYGTIVANKPFVTPLGKVNVAMDIINELKRNSMKIESEKFKDEHAIEVQLPFLQFVSKDRLDKLKIVPIIVGDDWKKSGIVDKLFDAIKLFNKKVVFIVSSDLIHYGRQYDYTPYVYNIEEETKKMNETIIATIMERNPNSFLELCDKTKATVCGKYAIATFLELLNKINPEAKAKMLMYSNSADKTGDYKNNVGYGSVMFY